MQNDFILSPIPLHELREMINSAVKNALQRNSGPETVPGDLISQKELCEKLRVAPSTLIRWKKKGKIPFVLVGDSPKYVYQQVINSLSKPVKNG